MNTGNAFRFDSTGHCKQIQFQIMMKISKCSVKAVSDALLKQFICKKNHNMLIKKGCWLRLSDRISKSVTFEVFNYLLEPEFSPLNFFTELT